MEGVDGYMIMYSRLDSMNSGYYYYWDKTTKTSYRYSSMAKGYMYAVVAYKVLRNGVVITSVPANVISLYA